MGYRILVVDDNEVNLALVSRILAMDQYDVVIANGGQEALDLIEQDPPDLAIIDMMMPEMDGFELCGKLRKLPACALIPILMLTASSSLQDQRRAKEAGVTAMLSKPFDMDALQKQVRGFFRL